jgi:hypothetical protein
MVLIDDGLGNGGNRNLHVFFLGHGRAEVEVFYIEGSDTSMRSGNDAVEQNFDGAEVGGWSADFMGVMDEIPTDGKEDAFLLCFVWPFGGYKACIGGLPSVW